MEGYIKSNLKKAILFGVLFLAWLCIPQAVSAETDADKLWSNASIYECTSRTGCNATSVYTYKNFYVNFWNPNGNIGLRSATVKIKSSSGTTVYEQTSKDYSWVNYFSFPIYLTSAGDYTLERSVTTTTGQVRSWSATTLTVYDISRCGTDMSLSSSNFSLSMTGTNSKKVTVKLSGVMPNSYGLSFSRSNTNVTCSWGSWYDSNGDGQNDSCDLTIKGQYGGTSTVDVSFYEKNSGKEITSGTISVTVGPNYTVTYYANGGSNAPSSQTKYYGKSLTLSSTKPTRTGYDFQGWGTSSSDTTVDYNPGASYTSNSSKSLYAIWKKKTYTVYYNANGGSGAPSSQTKTYGTTLTISSTKPSRTGYTFQGWGTSSGDTTVDYNAGGSYTSNSGITLYAIWKPIEYKIYYYANGGSGAPSTQTKYYGTSLTLSSTVPTRTGYDFQGWGTSSSDTSVNYKPGGTYSANSGISLYAIWKQKTYSVTYKANGGSGAPSTQTKYYGTTLTISSTKPSRTGYTFQGWGTSSTDTTVDYSAGSSYTLNSSITLYAIWSPKNYKVTYYANGGVGAPANMSTIYDNWYTISSAVPTRTGYDFQGWGTSSSDTTVDYQPGSIYVCSGNLKLYAIWKLREYDVTYDANGGSGTPSSQTKYYGKTLTLRTKTPTKTDYVFQGWGTTADDRSVNYKAGGKYSKNESIVLYAIWKQKQVLTTELNSTEKVIYKKYKTLSINATTNVDGAVTYKTSNSKVAKVSTKGVITIYGYGKATITVTAAGTTDYTSATKKITITVVPKKMGINQIASTKATRLKVSWKKDSTVSGYQVYVSPSSTFAKNTKKGTFKVGTTSTTLKNLKSKTRYYVKIRAYKTVNGTRYYGAWSDVESIKIK